MSVSVSREEDVTVITIRADSKSKFPPLCQLMGALCYSPVCCSAHKGLINHTVTALLGTVQIMMGLFHMSLGPGQPWRHPMDVGWIGAAYWLGFMYIAGGVASILAGRFLSLCMVICSVVMNVLSAIFALCGIVMYSIALQETEMQRYRYNYESGMLLTNIHAVCIVLAALQVCVCTWFTVMGIRALGATNKTTGNHDEDEKLDEPLKKISLTSPGA